MSTRKPPRRIPQVEPDNNHIDELRETIDLLATVVASVSNRVNAHGEILDQVNQSSAEARQAAFAASSQTDPKKYGTLIAETVDGNLRESLLLVQQAGQSLMKRTELTKAAMKQAEDSAQTILKKIEHREEQAARSKRNQPWLITGAALLGIALAVALPRFLASNATTCAAIGAVWQEANPGGNACVFYVN